MIDLLPRMPRNSASLLLGTTLLLLVVAVKPYVERIMVAEVKTSDTQSNTNSVNIPLEKDTSALITAYTSATFDAQTYSDYYGWIAACVSILSFGSFGVPIRSTKSIDVHPLVMQSFKTLVCFLTCGWILVACQEETLPWRSTLKWGLVSGLFWVPGATCGVYAIRNAGLAVAVGTWSSINVVSSFVFGILLFHENVKNVQATAMAFGCLILGLIGMARYASGAQASSSTTTMSLPLSSSSSLHANVQSTSSNCSATSVTISTSVSLINPASTHKSKTKQIEMITPKRSWSDVASIFKRSTSMPEDPLSIVYKPLLTQSITTHNSTHKREITEQGSKMYDTELLIAPVESNDSCYLDNHNHGDYDSDYDSLEFEHFDNGDNNDDVDHDVRTLLHKRRRDNSRIVLGVCCWNRQLVALTTRQVGVLCAVINGAWGGLNLIPMHFARKENPSMSAAGYVVPYACGSFIVNTLMWIFLFLYHTYHSHGQMRAAWQLMPSWHLKTLWLPGIQAGLLYSIGNGASIVAVSHLGQATGFAACQMQLLVSGLWGVLWFQEIKGVSAISKWFASACLAIVGIVWLSYEHEGGAAH
jgi:glucose uptake protein GlcU